MALRKIEVKTGEIFGYLTVIQETDSIKPRKHKIRMIKCQCICGKVTVVRLQYLRDGHTTSCGCAIVKELVKHRRTHGLSKTRLYGIWNGMKGRCYNRNIKSYKYYGAKGICVSDSWLEFVPFYEWAINNGYEESLTIERIDVKGNYEPTNCIWIPFEDQAKNKSSTISIEYNGETKSLSEWAKISGINHGTLYSRYSEGWTPSRMFEQPVRRSLQ